jgi:hypothetical protein
MNQDLTVIGGYLNFSLWILEIWGPTTQVDSLFTYFFGKLEDSSLIGIEPTKLSLTWRNKITRNARISKRIDRFMISKP